MAFVGASHYAGDFQPFLYPARYSNPLQLKDPHLKLE